MSKYPPERYPYFVRAYYADDVEPPKTPGGLAIETVHRTESSQRMDHDAANSRKDIGVVIIGERYST